MTDTRRTPTGPDGPSPEQREHEITMRVFSMSAGLIGVCLVAIGILRLVAAQSQFQTLGDELLALGAVLFVSCCYLSFWSFKTKDARLRNRLRLIVDSLFMLALALMVGVCTIIADALV